MDWLEDEELPWLTWENRLAAKDLRISLSLEKVRPSWQAQSKQWNERRFIDRMESDETLTAIRAYRRKIPPREKTSRSYK